MPFVKKLVCICILIAVPYPVAHGFGIPERLEYDLTWTGIKAGTAVLEIRNESDSLRIISTARSVDWVSVFYKVDDRIEAMLAKGKSPSMLGIPLHYRVRLKEGRHRRDKEVVFDHERHRAVFVNHIEGEKVNIPIQENIFDPLASFYYVRTLPAEVGKSVFVDILDSKKLWNVEVQVLRREKIRTKLGSFDTIVIRPLMKSEGIFNRKGDMYIWLTDDLKKIPVKMQTKVAVGSVTAILTGGNY